MGTLLQSAKRRRRNSPHSSLRMMLAAKNRTYELRTVDSGGHLASCSGNEFGFLGDGDASPLGPPGKTLIGSVAEEALRSLSVDILAVPPVER